ncbi:phosphatidylserine lipase ABHD16A isoform X2 [Onthophagus taurus]|uniref:phosphatidylserine lipase ABHD16A isoform X2 n=1 Tax=Onthophagus taurus TaxID=166361 RepID=UPI000C2086A0|nr:protein ABHD16A isoform X2 [Onthophagus taurus]
MSIKAVLDSMFSPRLIKIYGNGPAERLYEPNAFEKWGDQVIQSLYIIWKISVYSSPFLTTYLYRKGYFVADGLLTLSKFVTSLGVILVVSFCIRGVGRYQNATYQKFVKTLSDSQKSLTPANKQQLSAYDFEFFGWPVEFKWSDIQGESTKPRLYITRPVTHRTAFQFVSSLPCHILGYLAVHSFGIRLVYPGSLSLLQTILAQGLLQGRSKLVEVNAAKRYKLLARDGNEIDSMFVDKRGLSHNGSTLVICCEGNAGFYEVGVMGTPIEAGYSVLGWNHPGFAGSTGTPYPSQEQNAIDIVVQFAIHKLGFNPENIILFGWSIGGYTSSWAAMNYPDIKGVVLDASFDDILPLAVNHMPRWAESVVRTAIREYINLNNFEQLTKYSGPILLYRRTRDEVMCISEDDISSNRGNNLLLKLLKYRYPLIIGDVQIKVLKEYLSLVGHSQEQFLHRYLSQPDVCKSLLESYISEHSNSYPMRIGDDMDTEKKNQMSLYLATKYMKDYKSTHCTPLPADIFEMPWEANIETDYQITGIRARL